MILRRQFSNRNKLQNNEQLLNHQHLLTNIQIEVKEHDALATSYLSALQMSNGSNPEPSQVWGKYNDTLVKDNGLWKIVRKELKIFFSK